MPISRTLPVAVALAAGGLALSAPSTVHARSGTGSDECPNASAQLFGGLGGPGSGDIFKERHRNCVDFQGTHDFADWDDSETNTLQIFGSHNRVSFQNSNTNLISFDAGNGGGNTLVASGADLNGVEFGPTSANDVLTMVGTQGVGIGITGIDDYLLTDSSCMRGSVIIYTQSHQGSASDPIVLC